MKMLDFGMLMNEFHEFVARFILVLLLVINNRCCYFILGLVIL